MLCTVRFREASRLCGVPDGQVLLETQTVQDCTVTFAPSDTQCFAAPNFLLMDLLTPGLYMRQAFVSVQHIIAGHCGLVAMVLNLAVFPLSDHQLYAAVHTGVNALVYSMIGLPIATIRRCAYVNKHDFSAVAKAVACTPDWQPVGDLLSNSLLALGDVLTNWMNVGAMLIQQKITGYTAKCTTELDMSAYVEDGAKAIEGVQSLEALTRLTYNNGMPMSETLARVRVVGLSSNLMGVTDGKNVLYRSAHDGYVWAYGAWPFTVDVRNGMAAVTY